MPLETNNSHNSSSRIFERLTRVASRIGEAVLDAIDDATYHPAVIAAERQLSQSHSYSHRDELTALFSESESK